MRTLFAIVITMTFSYAHAAPERCGNVDFSVDYRPVKAMPWGWEQVTLTASSGSKNIVRKYEYVHFGIACLSNPKGKPYIVYQAYCSGSACRDFDNWGIIDPSSLEVLLEPDDHNRKKAQKIFGGPLKPF